ncbi:sigma factor [Actinomycetes bacterium KLBMP 9759]
MSALIDSRSGPDGFARDEEFQRDDYDYPADPADYRGDYDQGGYDQNGYDQSGYLQDDASGSMYQAQFEQDGPAASQAQLRVDFGAHLEANYQRLVAQLYAITLDPGEAHDVVQEAYSRAWRNWAEVGSLPDPAAWVRHVAVRSTMRSWRRLMSKLGFGRSRKIGEGVDPRTRSLLAALGRLSASERRSVVLFHMAGSSVAEIAAVEQVSPTAVEARLAKGRGVVTEGLADVLPAVLGISPDQPDDDQLYDDKGDNR